jgi:hypothetical protein
MLRGNWEVHCGKRLLTLQSASTAREALIEYLRSSGCRDEEMSTLGAASMGWNGAVYRAVAVAPPHAIATSGSNSSGT